MNREEAKFLLRAYRPNGEDASDPQFQEALELARRDPELSDWFARERAVDQGLAAKLRAFPVPADLKIQLLAARQTISPPSWWRRPAWVAAAAAVALLLTLAALSSRSPGSAQFEEFRSFVATIADSPPAGLELMSRDPVEVRQWLNGRGAPDDFVLPPGLRELPCVGCRLLEWNGRKVSFICFELGNEKMVHLFVIDRDRLKGGPKASFEFASPGGDLHTVAWQDQRKVYVLAGHGDRKEMMGLL